MKEKYELQATRLNASASAKEMFVHMQHECSAKQKFLLACRKTKCFRETLMKGHRPWMSRESKNRFILIIKRDS